MRNLMIVAALPLLAGCFLFNTEGDDRRRERERRAEQEAAEAGQRPTDPAAVEAAVGGGAAGDLAAPVETKRAGDASCGGMGGAEGFVRCVYAGLDRGTLDLADPERIKIVWGGTDAQLEEFKNYPAEFRASLVKQQLVTLCGCASPGRGAFGVRAVRMGSSSGDKAEARVTMGNGSVVTIQLKRQAGVGSFEDAG